MGENAAFTKIPPSRFLCCLTWFGDTRSPSWSRTGCVSLADLELTEILLPLLASRLYFCMCVEKERETETERERVLCSPGCPRNHYITQTDLNLAILLTQTSKCCEYISMVTGII